MLQVSLKQFSLVSYVFIPASSKESSTYFHDQSVVDIFVLRWQSWLGMLILWSIISHVSLIRSEL